jgi:hypothetical protein
VQGALGQRSRAARRGAGTGHAHAPHRTHAQGHPSPEVPMKDLLFVAITVAFFALAFAYAKAFDHL